MTSLDVGPLLSASITNLHTDQFSLFYIELFVLGEAPFVETPPAQCLALGGILAFLFAKFFQADRLAHGGMVPEKCCGIKFPEVSCECLVLLCPRV